MRGLSLPAASQRLMSAAAASCSSRVALNMAKPIEAAVLGVERADGKDRAGVAAGHEDHAAALGQQRNGLFEVRLADGFPPNVDAAGCEFFDAGGDVFRLVVDRFVGTEFAAQLSVFRRCRPS